MRLLFIMDSPERIDTYRDTTFAFMLEAQSRGWDLTYTRKEWLWSKNGRTFCRWHPARVARKEHPEHMVLGEGVDGAIEEHHAVIVRTDPPFDMDYVKMTWLLELVDSKKTFVMNNPAGIRAASEKLFTLHMPELTPRQIVTRSMTRLEEFLEEVGGAMVVKPIDWMGGYGVFVVRQGDENRRTILEVLTKDGRDLIVGQEYLPEAKEGDKRILVLNGEPLGAVLRVPAPGEHRGNIHVGARAEKTLLTDADRRVCEHLKPHLLDKGIYFAGIDVIGGKLTEVNVTSPTGIQEIDRLENICLEADVLDFIALRALGSARV